MKRLKRILSVLLALVLIVSTTNGISVKAAAPGAFSITAPTEGKTYEYGESITFKWTRSEGAGSYAITVRDAATSEIVAGTDKVQLITTSYSMPGSSFKEGGSYLVTVMAYGSTGEFTNGGLVKFNVAAATSGGEIKITGMSGEFTITEGSKLTLGGTAVADETINMLIADITDGSASYGKVTLDPAAKSYNLSSITLDSTGLKEGSYTVRVWAHTASSQNSDPTAIAKLTVKAKADETVQPTATPTPGPEKENAPTVSGTKSSYSVKADDKLTLAGTITGKSKLTDIKVEIKSGSKTVTSVSKKGSSKTYDLSNISFNFKDMKLTPGSYTIYIYAVTEKYKDSSKAAASIALTVKDTDENMAKADKDALTIGFASGDSKSSVSADITLRTSGSVNGSTITWKSSNTKVITAKGKVTQPSSKKTVTMTATIKYGTASLTKTFTLTVPKKPTLSITSASVSDFTVGDTPDIKGSVKASAGIKSISAKVIKSSGSKVVLSEKKLTLSSKTSFKLSDSDFGNLLKYDTLSAGSYKLVVTVTDKKGNTYSKKLSFTVEKKAKKDKETTDSSDEASKVKSSDTSDYAVYYPTPVFNVFRSGTKASFDYTASDVACIPSIDYLHDYEFKGVIYSGYRDSEGNVYFAMKNGGGFALRSENYEKLAFTKLVYDVYGFDNVGSLQAYFNKANGIKEDLTYILSTDRDISQLGLKLEDYGASDPSEILAKLKSSLSGKTPGTSAYIKLAVYIEYLWAVNGLEEAYKAMDDSKTSYENALKAYAGAARYAASEAALRSYLLETVSPEKGSVSDAFITEADNSYASFVSEYGKILTPLKLKDNSTSAGNMSASDFTDEMDDFGRNFTALIGITLNCPGLSYWSSYFNNTAQKNTAGLFCMNQALIMSMFSDANCCQSNKALSTVDYSYDRLTKLCKAMIPELESESISVNKGKTKTLKISGLSSDAKITFKSSDTSKVKISNDGVITGVTKTSSPVKVTITVKQFDKTFTLVCEVTVK